MLAAGRRRRRLGAHLGLLAFLLRPLFFALAAALLALAGGRVVGLGEGVTFEPVVAHARLSR